MPKNILRIKKAFSLFELSIVITVIAVLVFGVLQGGQVLNKAKVASAAALTKASVVGKMDGLVAWFETTMPTSFNDIEETDGGAIATWFNLANPLTTNNATAGNAPTYISGVINGLPVLRFNGTSNFLSFDGTFLANTNYTIFVVEQRRSSKIFNYFLAGPDSTNNSNLHLGYRTDILLTHAQFGNDYDIAVNAYSSPTPRIHIFRFSASSGKDYVLNGNINTGGNTTGLISYNGARIGSYNFYNGDIAEIIIFNRALKDQERQDVEAYLGKKWGITVL